MGRTFKRELLFSRQTIQKRVNELAEQISSDYEEKEPVIIGVLNGAVFFFADLVRQLSIPIKMDFIRAISYGSEMTSSGSIRLTKDVDITIRGEPVIVVEDIVDSGLTLNHIINTLELKKPESLRICALIDKLERREVNVSISYCGFQINEGFIVGYGLDYNEMYRQLPEIYILR